MGDYCFIPTTEAQKLADNIATLSQKSYKDHMAVLSNVFPYILDKDARTNEYDPSKVNIDIVLSTIAQDWKSWKPYIRDTIMKALDNFTLVEFREVQSIVNNKQTDENSYNNLLSKYALVDHQRTDEKGNSLLYQDLKMQLLIKAYERALSEEDAVKNLGYEKLLVQQPSNTTSKEGASTPQADNSLAKIFMEQNPDFDAKKELAQLEEERRAEEVRTVPQIEYSTGITTKDFSLQLKDVRFKMSIQERRRAVNMIAHAFMNYLDRQVATYQARVKEYAKQHNVSILQAKWDIAANNAVLNKRIQKELALGKPNYSYIDKWKSQIIPLDEIEVIKLFSAKEIALKLYQSLKAKNPNSPVVENFDALFREAASTVNKVYNINLLGNLELYDNFTEGSDTEDPSDSDANIDSQKEDYSHADDKTRASEISLSKKIKRAYTKCYVYDKDGNPTPVNISTAHAKVLTLTQNMIDKDDLIPMLSKSQEDWVQQFIQMLENDEDLFKQLYRVIKLSAQDYRIIYYDKTQGPKQKSINLNSLTRLIQQETVANIETGITLSQQSLYDTMGFIDKSNIETIKAIALSLQQEIINAKTIDDIKDAESRFTALINSLGISLPEQFSFNESLSTLAENGDTLAVLNTAVGKIMSIINNAEKITKDKDNVPLRAEDSYYKWLYTFIGNSAIGYSESVSTEQGKSYYTYSKTNYFDELLLKLKRSVKGKKTSDGRDYYSVFRDTHFGNSEYFRDSKSGRWRSDWLAKLFDESPLGNLYRSIIARSSIINSNLTGNPIDNLEYTEWDERTALLSSLIMFQQGEDFSLPNKKERVAWYRMPIASDSPAGDYLRFIAYTGEGYQDIILDRLWSTLLQEIVRINEVRNHLNNKVDSKDDIKSYDAKVKDGVLTDAGGLIFTLMPQLNYIKADLDNSAIADKLDSDTIEMLERNGANFIDIIQYLILKKQELNLKSDDIKGFFKQIYTNWSNKNMATEFQEVDEYLYSLWPNKSVDDRYKLWEEYSLNYQLAFTQMVQLTSTDLAFYGKRVVQKATVKDGNFTYKGQHYKIVEDTTLNVFQKRNKEYHAPTNKIAASQEYYTEVYLKDMEIPSQILENVKAIVANNTELSAAEKKRIIALYSKDKTNIADGQALRSLSSYKQILKDMGELSPEVEEAFDRIIKTKKWDLGDLSIITLAIKPYVYTTIPVERDTTKRNGTVETLMVPTQHKNSEYPVLAALGAISMELQNNPVLEAIKEFMDKHRIDVIHFNSVVKVGELGTVTLDWTNPNKDEIVQSLDKQCGFDTMAEGNPSRVHKIPTESWGIQTNKPEHLIDKQQLVGSQPRRLILADIPETNPDGTPYTIDVNGKKYTKKEFVTHYQNLIIANLIQSYNSVDKLFKNPQKLAEFLRGQIATSDKYDTDLLDAFAWDAENQRFSSPFWDQSISNRVEELLNGLIRNRISKQKARGGSAVQAAGIGMTKKLNVRYRRKTADGYEILDTYEEWLEKNPQGTKDQYEEYVGDAQLAYMECLLPLWSKDLMEAMISEDGSIDANKLPDSLKQMIGYRVPTEDHYSIAPLKVVGFLPTLAASSIMLPADITKIAGSDFDIDVMYLLLKNFKVNKIDFAKAITQYNSEVRQSDRIDIATSSLVADMFGLSEQEVSQEAAEKNRQFMRWLNRHEEDFLLSKSEWTISPVEYDSSLSEFQNTKEARDNELVDMMYGCLTAKHSIEKFTNPGNFEEPKKASRICEAINLGNKTTLENLVQKEISELEIIISQLKGGTNIASPITAVDLHQQNMIGSQLVGIFAVANAMQQIFQYAPIQSNIHFTINWNKSNPDWVIGKMRNGNKSLITKNIASYLAAAVDNGKDPIMSALQANPDSANIIIYLSLLGYTPLEIGLFMNCANRHTSVDDDIVKQYVLSKNESSLDLEQMTWAIQNPNTVKGAAIIARAKFAMNGVKLGANTFNTLTQILRADSVNGSVGKSVFDNISKSLKWNTFVEQNQMENYTVLSKIGDPTSMPELPIHPFTVEKVDINERIETAKLPYLQAFSDTTITASYQWLRPYSLLLNPAIYNRLNSLKSSNGYIGDKLVAKYLNDLQQWWLMQTALFGDEKDMPLSKKKQYYIEEFPKEFIQYKQNLPKELEGNAFIENVILVKSDKQDPYPHLVVKELGISKTIREQFKSDFAQLATVNPDMAIKLFVYTAMRNGFAYSQTGWAHLVPTAFKQALPEYNEKLFSLIDLSNDEAFFEQFVRNNYRLFPSLAPDILKEIPSKKRQKEAIEKFKASITTSRMGTFSRYVTLEKELYAEYKQEEDKTTSYVKLSTLGLGKFYHEYDNNGGISMFKEQVDTIAEEIDNAEDLPDEAFETLPNNEKNPETTDKETLTPVSKNDKRDDNGNPMC